MSKPILTQERLKQLLSYDPDTGVLTRLVTTSPNAVAGQVAGSINKISGYHELRVDSKLYYGHRLAWFYLYGEWPVSQLDHINRVRSDNRLSNLRLAENSENAQNMSFRVTNKSGRTGVCWHKGAGKWMAQIWCNNKKHHLGVFEDVESAYEAYKDAKRRLHTFSPCAI